MADYKRLYEVQTQIEYLSKDKLTESLGAHGKDIEQYAYILHDKDVQEDGTPKKPHWHIELKLCKSRRRSDVAAWFGVVESCVQDSKSGKYENMLQYLIHENAPEKHQYSIEEVSSNFNYAERLEAIRSGKIKLDKDARKNELMEMAASGALRRYNWSKFLSVEEWDKYKKSIQNAWEYRDNQIRSTRRNMEVIYICGTGRCGKSTLAQKIAESKGFSYEASGSSRDAMQPYNGQDAYILDDIRGNSFVFDDLMGILDNFVNREVPARYRDKSLSECKLMIVTTTQPIKEFFEELAKDRPEEPSQQLYGRCGTMIEMDRDTIKISEWNSELEEYSTPLVTENHVLDDVPVKKPRSEAERKERAAELLGVDQSLLTTKIEVEEPEGVLPPEREEPLTPNIRFIKDTDRTYLIADNVSPEVQEMLERFANRLLKYI